MPLHHGLQQRVDPMFSYFSLCVLCAFPSCSSWLYYRAQAKEPSFVYYHMNHTKQELFQTELDLLKGRERHPYLQHLLTYLKKGDTVLDIGCGLLINSLYLQDKGFSAVGMDISIRMLQEDNNPDIPIVCADGLTLPFKQNSFGGLLLIDVIEHLPRGKVDEFLKEAKRVLKNDAVVFLHVPLEKSLSYRFLNTLKVIWPKNPNHLHDYTLKEITSLLKGKGCKILWNRKENGFVCSLRYYFKEIKLLVVLSTFLGRLLNNLFTAAYTACISFEPKLNKKLVDQSKQ